MNRKYLPGAMVLLGLLGSVLPIISVKVTSSDEAIASYVGRALPESQSAWAFDGAGLVLLAGLALIAAFAGAIAATRLRRVFSVPMAALNGQRF